MKGRQDVRISRVVCSNIGLFVELIRFLSVIFSQPGFHVWLEQILITQSVPIMHKHSHLQIFLHLKENMMIRK